MQFGRVISLGGEGRFLWAFTPTGIYHTPTTTTNKIPSREGGISFDMPRETHTPSWLATLRGERECVFLLEHKKKRKKRAVTSSPLRSLKQHDWLSMCFCLCPHHYHPGKAWKQRHKQKTAGNPARRKQFKALRLSVYRCWIIEGVTNSYRHCTGCTLKQRGKEES